MKIGSARWIAPAVVAVVMSPTTSTAARTSGHSGNGAITFEASVRGFDQIFTVGSDGKNLHQVTRLRFANSGVPGFENPNWSPDGSTIIFDSDFKQTPEHVISVFTIRHDGTGFARVPIGVGAFDGAPAYSHDGREIAFDWDANTSNAHPGGIDIANSDGSNIRRVTQETQSPSNFDSNSNWSPDDSWIAFTRYRGNASAIFKVRPDGSGLEQLTPWSMWAADAHWSPDGSKILFESNEHSTVGKNANIYTMNPDGSDAIMLTHFSDGQTQARVGDWSPDGKWIVWHRRAVDPNGPAINDLFIMRADGTGIRRLTHLAHGANPSHAAWGTTG